MNFFPPIRRHKTTAALLLLALAAGAVFLSHHRKPRMPLHPNITTPALAIESLDAQSPYFTGEALPLIEKKKPQWVNKTELGNFLQAQRDPGLWRKLDHQYHFDAILLCGDPGEYHPLLQHLIVTRDWTLTYLDHTSLIFRRPPAKPWSPADFQALQQKFASYSGPDRVAFLTQTAAKLLAIGQPALAKQQLDEALRLDKRTPEIWTQLAAYEIQRGKWQEAVENVDHALRLDKNDSHALVTKAQIFYATKRYNDALALSERLVQASPDDPNVLFFHAKITHEAHAYTEEIATLRHLIEIGEREHWPCADYRVYLGQAYAKDGQAAAALEEFEKARAEGGLSNQQLDYVRDSIQQIKSRTSL